MIDSRSWFVEAYQVLQEIRNNGPQTSLGWFEPHVIQDWFNSGEFDRLAAAALNEYLTFVDCTPPLEVFAEMAEFLEGKQDDYGPQNILRFGSDGLQVRLWDKVARYLNLRSRPETAANESVVDTLADMVGYVVIGKMLDRGTFTLPTRREQRLGSVRMVEWPDEDRDVRVLIEVNGEVRRLTLTELRAYMGL